MSSIRVVHYLNQFFAGLGGEEKADVGPGSAEKAVGPAIGLAQSLGEDGAVAATVWCGDNYIAAGDQAAVDEVVRLIGTFAPDVVVTGPAFASGRYGLACAEVCHAVATQLRVPAVTAMHPDSPAADDFRRSVVIVPCAESALGMGAVLPILARLALKLGSGQALGSPAEEGYLSQGLRQNVFAETRGAARAVEMLKARLGGEPVATELPLPKYRRVPPPPPLAADLTPRIALVAEGGLVPKGNPGRMPSGWCRVWAKYDIENVADLTPDAFETIHGGYDTSAANEDPDRIIPLDTVRDLEQQGALRVVNALYATCGNHGSIGEMQRIGREIAADMRAQKVDAVIVGST